MLSKFGFFNAAELMDTLSAPALNKSEISLTDLTPPPTVKGINTFFATF